MPCLEAIIGLFRIYIGLEGRPEGLPWALMFLDCLLKQVLGRLDLLRCSLNRDHPFVILVRLPNCDACF